MVGTRAGFSERRIVVVAHRDALDRPATAQLSGTAGLIELARVFRGRTLRKTLVLASTSGGSAGRRGRDRGGAAPGRQRRRRARARRPGRRPAAPPDGRAVVQRPRPRPARAAAHGRGRAATRGRAAPGPGGGVRAVRAAGLSVHDGRAGRVRGARLPLGARVGQRGARSRRRALRDAARVWPTSDEGCCARSPPSTRDRGRRRLPRTRSTSRTRCCRDGPCAWSPARSSSPCCSRRSTVWRGCAAAGTPWACGWPGCSRLPFPSPGLWRLPSSCVSPDSCRRRRPGRRRRAPYRSTRPRSS